MLAYVDENGMITSTPPDPTKKIVIKSEILKFKHKRRIKITPKI
jgi:hypothetical protein